MAETGKRNDPFPSFRFEVLFDQESMGGFSECTGLTLETEVHEYSEGGTNNHIWKFPTRTKQGNITLKRGIVDSVLWKWYYDLTQGVVSLRNLSILVHDLHGDEPAMHWQCIQCFPCKWTGPDLNATQSNVAVETFEICHRGIKRVV